MKIAVCGDIHWSQYSSIVRKREESFSSRLENIIKSVDWVNTQADINGCNAIVFLGDFFDKAELNAEEITALAKVEWSNIPKYFICGNHEMMSVNHQYSSAKIFGMLHNAIIVDKPMQVIDNVGNSIHFLPYILESDRQPIETYFECLGEKRNPDMKNILFSHNDIKGIQMGSFLSQAGFTVEEFDSIADITFNGHLHNGCAVTPSIINLGNLTGQNFSEDASKYAHKMCIIDTDRCNWDGNKWVFDISYIENPYAFNFYSITPDNIDTLNYVLPNAVVSVVCNADDYEKVKDMIRNNSHIIESRVQMQKAIIASDDEIATQVQDNLAMDNHIEAFRTFSLNKLSSDDDTLNKELMKELDYICGDVAPVDPQEAP